MILRLAHVEICVPDLDEARAFYAGLLGFVEHADDAESIYLRGAEEFDAWSLKITRSTGGGLVHSGFRVSERGDLDRIERIHEVRGLPIERVPAGTEPGQGEALRTLTPEGHRVEFFHDFDEIDLYAEGRLRLPMRNSHRLTGVPPARIDHVSLRVPDMAVALSYWCDDLEFGTAEVWLDGDGDHQVPRVAWVRRTSRSHDVALGRNDGPAFHHFAFAVSDTAALARAADLLGDVREQGRLEWGPSRHGATNAVAMYIRDPAGNRLELYHGDYLRDLDRPPVVWRPDDYELQGHSWWGHGPPGTFGENQPLAGEWVGS